MLLRNFGSLRINIRRNFFDEIETMNLGDQECVKEVKISVHLNEAQRKDLIHFISKYIDVLVLEYNYMLGMSSDVVSHKLSINPGFISVKQKTQKFKPNQC